jgi:hypothetical protein
VKESDIPAVKDTMQAAVKKKTRKFVKRDLIWDLIFRVHSFSNVFLEQLYCRGIS